MAQERRRHPRTAIELQVEYDRLNSFFADFARNICQGGTFVETDEPLDVGTEATFVLSAPGLEQPLSLRGRVAWNTRSAPPPPGAEAHAGAATGMGVHFVYDSDQERLEMEEGVGRLMREQLGELLFVKLMGRSGSR